MILVCVPPLLGPLSKSQGASSRERVRVPKSPTPTKSKIDNRLLLDDHLAPHRGVHFAPVGVGARGGEGVADRIGRGDVGRPEVEVVAPDVVGLGGVGPAPGDGAADADRDFRGRPEVGGGGADGGAQGVVARGRGGRGRRDADLRRG